MNIVFLRRKGLGKPSVDGIIANSKHDMTVVRNNDPDLVKYNNVDIWIRWGCTSKVPQNGDKTYTLWNDSCAINACSDKAGFRKLMLDFDYVNVPKTWFSYKDVTIPNQNFEVILRLNKHAQGKQLHTCYASAVEITTDFLGWEEGSYYISEYIPKVREYRIYVMFGKVACVAEKHPKDPTQIAWNHSQGASFKNVKWNDWPLDACRQSINALLSIHLDFGGVDVLEDSSGTSYVLEVNSAPTLTSKYRQECFAKVFDYEIEFLGHSITTNTELIEQPITSWKECIHPGVWNND